MHVCLGRLLRLNRPSVFCLRDRLVPFLSSLHQHFISGIFMCFGDVMSTGCILIEVTNRENRCHISIFDL